MWIEFYIIILKLAHYTQNANNGSSYFQFQFFIRRPLLLPPPLVTFLVSAFFQFFQSLDFLPCPNSCRHISFLTQHWFPGLNFFQMGIMKNVVPNFIHGVDVTAFFQTQLNQLFSKRIHQNVVDMFSVCYCPSTSIVHSINIDPFLD